MQAQQPEKKTADRKEYMRQYMKRRYDEEKQRGIIARTKYYYVHKGEATEDDKKKYKDSLPTIVKLRKLIDKLKPDIEMLNMFKQELQNV